MINATAQDVADLIANTRVINAAAPTNDVGIVVLGGPTPDHRLSSNGWVFDLSRMPVMGVTLPVAG